MQLHKWSRIEMFVCTLVFLMSFSFVALLFFAKWPNWWEWTVPEQSPLTWMQSLILFLNALVAISLVLLSYLRNEIQNMRWWVILSLGFLYLMLDERFAIHERIRDSYLAPEQIKIPIFFWTSAGDFLLLLYAIIALFLIYPYLKLFKVRKSAMIWLIIGFSLAIIAVTIDSIPFKTYSIIFQNTQQFTEELLEIVVMNCVFTALFLILSFHLQRSNTNR